MEFAVLLYVLLVVLVAFSVVPALDVFEVNWVVGSVEEVFAEFLIVLPELEKVLVDDDSKKESVVVAAVDKL